MIGIRLAALAALLAAPLLAGCQSSYGSAARVGGPAEPYARSWSVPGSPRPDTPPDRDGFGQRS